MIFRKAEDRWGSSDIGYLNQLLILHKGSYLAISLWAFTALMEAFFLPRVIGLTYTTWDMELFAKDLGFEGYPFKWGEEREFLIRWELDAAFFHLYLPINQDTDWKTVRRAEGATFDGTEGELKELKRHFPTPSDVVLHIMGTYPVVLGFIGNYGYFG